MKQAILANHKWFKCGQFMSLFKKKKKAIELFGGTVWIYFPVLFQFELPIQLSFIYALKLRIFHIMYYL